MPKKKKSRKRYADDYQKQLNNLNKIIIGATGTIVLTKVGLSAVKAFSR